MPIHSAYALQRRDRIGEIARRAKPEGWEVDVSVRTTPGREVIGVCFWRPDDKVILPVQFDLDSDDSVVEDALNKHLQSTDS